MAPHPPHMCIYNWLNTHGTYCTYTENIYARQRLSSLALALTDDNMEDISSLAVDESSCAICGEIFLVPVVLSCISCGYSFCSSCLEQFWVQHGTKECPLCYEENPGPPQRICEEHGEKLSLFCVGDLVPVCSLCHRSGLHVDHRVYPIKEALEDCKVS